MSWLRPSKNKDASINSQSASSSSLKDNNGGFLSSNSSNKSLKQQIPANNYGHSSPSSAGNFKVYGNNAQNYHQGMVVPKNGAANIRGQQQQQQQQQQMMIDSYQQKPPMPGPASTQGIHAGGMVGADGYNNNNNNRSGPGNGIPPPHTSTSPSSSVSNRSASSNSAAANAQPPSSSGRKTGVLVIRVMEGRNLSSGNEAGGNSLLSQQQQSLAARYAPYRNEPQHRPYAVVEFDRNEVVMAALGGDNRNPIWNNRAHFDVSRASNVMITLYQRTSEVMYPKPPLPTQQNRGYQRFGGGHPDQNNNGDQNSSSGSTPITGAVFLGSVRIIPDFINERLVDDWFPLFGGSGGSIRIQYCFNKKDATPLSIDDFELLKVIGKGSFGKVMQVRKRDTNRIYAMKILNKSKIVMRSEVAHTLAERTVLAKINHPFIVPLKFSFQNPQKLYFVLAFINGGELFHHLQNEGRFDQNRSRFYAAELLSALECLHSYNVIYRDLKPENILLDFTGHIALCDFGLCKLDMSDTATTNTFCGTPEYLAPELLRGQGYTKTVDWWTFGVLLFEMLTGLPPFYDDNVNEMYRRILEDPLVFPDDMGSRAKHLLRGLLDRNPNTRLGNNGALEIKQQPFFAEIDWDFLLGKKYEPPFKPSVASAIDTSNFDEEFTSEMPQDSYVPDAHLSETVQMQFAGFTFDGSGGAMSLAHSMNGGDGFRGR
ncbi:Serine/threonine-protein kinase [Mycoemilia scoparia]|uniref:non-specific serine/threonine protein kinase n=1 Tax=Mycoemilia scoparia TaxID=417184 RepID=A0A9W8DKB5_9FUNG|nr:Serine/threonine-protein kinase [Mycoemilia scoparia]